MLVVSVKLVLIGGECIELFDPVVDGRLVVTRRVAERGVDSRVLVTLRDDAEGVVRRCVLPSWAVEQLLFVLIQSSPNLVKIRDDRFALVWML